MNYIKGTIDRIEEDKAVINLGNGHNLTWPVDKLPTNHHEGDAVRIHITEDVEQTTISENTAVNVLNEILKDD
ncbi:DUF3006 domain-containing protein [Candidatus Falkowbacteria bacterium]|jgi:hypothetical protein|nr:DUF3006 domain-containing protein [Candidatus Falkowbacteria bacterium]MBT5503035.1 DUF3006 domain-containing protein [Candidatus Falkowbacteria bacterium]MBT6574146.1 DUF3006 domain-containing protein [Candidatus Falkowbacteria bacterium]MBT7348707.1 DUF3006 domain-containing protein [Candidatus Falkowbacteria bacterium]MBT7500497.1 DUF3006 domain-containing protein [Candidatus Falkowbacteria bacterium]